MNCITFDPSFSGWIIVIQLGNNCYCFLISSNIMFFFFFFSFSSRSNGLSLSVRLAAFGIHFERWLILPRKDLSCFSERGCSNLSMASVFVIFGVTPHSESLKPNQFTSVLKNSHFDSFRDKFFSSNFVKTSVINFSCSVYEPFETISISSKKQNVVLALFSVRSIAFWNSAGMSANP